MIQVAQGFWFHVMDTDSQAVLVPWAEENISQHHLVTKMAEFPTSLTNFRKYFPQAQPRMEGVTVYTSIFMAHDVPFEEMMENMGWWMKEREIGLYFFLWNKEIV
jgi:hypothetical protein